ncbi:MULTISPECIES: BMP family protein [unclassified Granulicatella]|uniref:BMP family lipoprotein n=1 Tax=unclassified Granulicatella TaxID=2630493 RepID=UPI001074858F|nr:MULTISPECIES: BMP family protein [unclassified Granulicatella]MBF0780053.1 BMP family protein [Granulicatella sp. 19428wC4_WM01]TFU95840.1 BMP family ABC transporter substrate-binding protein [Granulicatella sp. WM01]
MSKRKVLGLSLAAVVLLAACGNNNSSTKTETTGASSAKESKKFSVLMMTDGGGVDDKSFNQSAWEGLQAWGKETGRSKGVKGYNYIQPSGEREYETSISAAVDANYDLIFGVGYQWEEALNKGAATHTDSKFVLIDSVLDKKLENGASILFAEHEAAFLAGVAAAKATKTNHIGYIGGVQSETLIRFESGFVAGAKSVNKDIKIDREYVGSFSDSAKGKILANTMYTSGADIIYAAAGGAGLGVFSSATDSMASNPSKELWVIGVDKDQHTDGAYKTSSGEEKSVTLTSTLKKVGDAISQFAKDTEANGFKAGIKRYTLKDGAVDLTDGQLSDEIKTELKKVKEKIIDGSIKVPSTYSELDTYLAQ